MHSLPKAAGWPLIFLCWIKHMNKWEKSTKYLGFFFLVLLEHFKLYNKLLLIYIWNLPDYKHNAKSNSCVDFMFTPITTHRILSTPFYTKPLLSKEKDPSQYISYFPSFSGQKYLRPSISLKNPKPTAWYIFCAFSRHFYTFLVFMSLVSFFPSTLKL